MVNLSPDTTVGGDWLNGYLYGDTNIRCFSHVHGWQLYGVPVMPQTGELESQKGLAAAASPFSHADEIIHPGYHKVFLQRYGITAELTSTTRVGFHRYTFPASEKSFIAFDTGAALMDKMDSSAIRQVSPTEIAGYSVMSPTQRRPKPFTIYFVAQFSKPVAFGAWQNGKLLDSGSQRNLRRKRWRLRSVFNEGRRAGFDEGRHLLHERGKRAEKSGSGTARLGF